MKRCRWPISARGSQNLMADVLTIENVTAGYGRSLALRGISLGVPVGQNVAVVVPSGAGKSTLLKMLSGIVRARTGTVTFEGRPLHAMAPDRIVGAGVV